MYVVVLRSAWSGASDINEDLGLSMRSLRRSTLGGQCTRGVITCDTILCLNDLFPLILGAVVEVLTYGLVSSSVLGSSFIEETLILGLTTSSSRGASG